MKIIFLFLFLSLSIYAQTINAQIHALEHASPKERVSLMNSIKKKLVMMNEDERRQTLGILKAKLHRRREEHNDNQRIGNISSHEEQYNHEMMHQGVKGSHTLHHDNNSNNTGHDNGGDKVEHDNGGDKASGHDGKGDNAGHDRKHSMIHAKVYGNNSRGK